MQVSQVSPAINLMLFHAHTRVYPLYYEKLKGCQNLGKICSPLVETGTEVFLGISHLDSSWCHELG